VSEVRHVARHQWRDVAWELRDAGFVLLADLTAVDYLEASHPDLPAEVEPERFEVVVVLRRLEPAAMVRLRTQVPEADPTLESLTPVYPGAEAFEREVYDLVGVRFLGHPDLSRILLPEDWECHPLRKDYSVGRVPVQFKEVRRHR
jgi:NADH-quinone oxidoreductase subunit C